MSRLGFKIHKLLSRIMCPISLGVVTVTGMTVTGMTVTKIMMTVMMLAVMMVTLSGCDGSNKNGQLLSNENPNTNHNFLSANGTKADPNYTVTLPIDHQSHPDFDIEWWYLTANLESDSGDIYAFQWTLFRFANSEHNNAWHQGQSFMAHTSLHTPQEHWFEERFATGGIGNGMVGVVGMVPSNASVNVNASINDHETPASQGQLVLKLDDWSWTAHQADGSLFPSTLSASVTKGDTRQVSINFELTQTGDFVLQGKQGYSVKSAQGKHASHYYSLPFIDIQGYIKRTSPAGTDNKINLSGKAWYDHEWTSTLLDDTTEGWDWMSLHFDNGDKLMAFSMRLNDPSQKLQQNYQTGTYIRANGDAITLLPQDISLNILHYTDVEARTLPLHWEVKVPDHSLDIKVSARQSKAFNPSVFGYYEGDVIVEGSHTGVGFLELTGY